MASRWFLSNPVLDRWFPMRRPISTVTRPSGEHGCAGKKQAAGFVGSPVLSSWARKNSPTHPLIASWFDLIWQRKLHLSSLLMWVTTPSLVSCPANKRWCAQVASIRNQIRPSAEIVGCGRFLWTAAAQRCYCNDQAPFCRRLVLRETAICLPSPNWTLPMSPTPHCVWGLWGWAAFKIRLCG